jgi:hypothetical protein
MEKQMKMTDQKLNAFLDAELRQCIGFGQSGDYIAAEREKALKYYFNRPRPDDLAGRSRVQSSDVQDVIEGFLPSLLAPFISSDKVVEFMPVGEGDEEAARQATATVNHCLMVENDGVRILYQWAKDALLQKNGFVYADWAEKECTKRVQQRVDMFGLQQITENKENEIISVTASDAMGGQYSSEQVDEGQYADDAVFDVDYRTRWKQGYCKIDVIAPENFVVSNTAANKDDARIIGWREKVTVSDLRREGYDEEKIEMAGKSVGDTPADQTGEFTERWRDQGSDVWSGNTENSVDPASQTLWRSVFWTRVDYDGDGKAEIRKIIRAGVSESSGVILYNEEVDMMPISSFTPIINPHQVFGRSFADLVFDIQDSKTVMWRMVHDSTYHTVYPRHVLDTSGMGDDTWDDLQNTSPNAIIRVERMGAVMPYRDSVDISAAYQALEYNDRIREVRTPVTRQMQGVDPDVLNDRTAREATIQANASQQRLELVMRLFAESVGELCKIILQQLIKNQDKPKTIRLTNKWVQVDPRYWNADMDVSARVGLGTGTKDQQVQALMMINNLQMQDMQMGLPTVDVEKLYNTRARIVENAGLSTPETYFNNPSDKQEGEEQAQQPDPAQQEAMKQEEAQKVQEAIQNALKEGEQRGMDQAKMQIEQMKLQMQAQIEAAKLQASRQNDMEQMASKERMHDKEMQVRLYESQTGVMQGGESY